MSQNRLQGTLQRDAFLGGEGDRYFLRNDARELTQQARRPFETLSEYLKPGDSVLEIGCGDGRNLNFLKSRSADTKCLGLDPSAVAIAAGSRKYPKISIQTGSAECLPYGDACIDLVHFGFCLYLVDRHLLLRAVAEADRVLKDHGMLSIVDFDPVHRCKRSYRHLEGLYSFKADYSAPFIAIGHYQLVRKSSHSHSGLYFEPDPAKRVGHWLLHKDVEGAYGFEADISE